MPMQVKGAILLSRRAFVQEMHGDATWRRVVDAVPASVRDQISSMIVSSAWYPFEACKQLDAAIARVLGKSRDEVYRQLGVRSAQQNLKGAHKNFLMPGDPQAFMAKTDRVYSFYYAQGRRSYEATGPSSGVMTTHDAETFSDGDCLTVIGWYEEALRMCGARDVLINETRCRARGDSVCRYELRWTNP
jgi:uncharacterized protein (TIGR02265 family)